MKTTTAGPIAGAAFPALLTAALLSMARPAVAQVPTASKPGVPGKVECCSAFPAALTARWHAGDWTTLHAEGLSVLRALQKQPALAGLLGDPAQDYHFLVWEGRGLDGERAVFRLLVHDGLTPETATRLPGLQGARGRIRDVFLHADETSRLASVFVSTPQPSPLVAQIPAVVKALGLPALAASIASATGPAVAAVEKGIWVSVNTIELPFPRAQIKVQDTAVTPTSASGLDRFKKSAKDLADELRIRQARTSTCAQQLAVGLRDAFVEVAKTCEKAPPGCAAMLEGQAEETYSTVVAACHESPTPGPGYDPVLEVEGAFRGLIEGLEDRVVRAEATLANVPLTRLSFGIGTGLILGSPSLEEPRVKTENGLIVNAPLERPLSMIVLNIHPRPYDAERHKMTGAERFRFFAAGILTPDFGLGAGAAVGVVRGLSVGAGRAVLFSNTPKSGETIGEAPKDAGDPFKMRANWVWFASLVYAFE